jgi:hypothetical protein
VAKHTFKIGSSAADAEPGGGGFYDGPKPPAGVYTGEIKFMRIKVNKNGDDMLNILTEIAEPKGDRAKYNGYGVWDNLNITDENAGRVNALLDALGINRKQFWPPNGPQVDNNDPPNITKIGTKRPEGCKLRIATKDDEYQGVERLITTRYLPLKGNEEAEDEADDADDQTDESADESADDAGADSGEATGDEPLTEEDLAGYNLDELKEICDAWELPYTARATEKVLTKKILEAQEAALSADSDDADEPAEEETPDDDGGYTEEDLKGEDLARLKEILTDEFEVALPKPPIKPRLIKAILVAQAEALGGEPPF